MTKKDGPSCGCKHASLKKTPPMNKKRGIGLQGLGVAGHNGFWVGSPLKQGLWDNIRANIGSGRKPTKAMLAEAKKIKSKTKK